MRRSLSGYDTLPERCVGVARCNAVVHADLLKQRTPATGQMIQSRFLEIEQPRVRHNPRLLISQ